MLRRLFDKCWNFFIPTPQRVTHEKRNTEICTLFGCQNFEELVRTAYPFVDKTLLIHELLKLRSKAILFTRPRRWGKTLNLSMLGTFFQPDIDLMTGEIFYDKQSKKHLFEDLKIKDAYLSYDPVTGEQEKTKVIDCQGSFPVISLTFGGNAIKTNEGLIDYYSRMLLPAFQKHSYLLNIKGILVGRSYEIFQKHIDEQKLNEVELTNSLDVLIVALNKHYKRKVIFLLDEYDRNLMNLASDNSPLYKDTLTLTKGLLDPLKF